MHFLAKLPEISIIFFLLDYNSKRLLFLHKKSNKKDNYTSQEVHKEFESASVKFLYHGIIITQAYQMNKKKYFNSFDK